MSSLQKTIIVISCFSLGLTSSISTASDYPYQPVPFTDVRFSDTFWLPRIETNRTATIPFAFQQAEETGRIENFKVAGNLSDKLWQGDFGYNDSDVFKIIEGAAYGLMVHPDPQLEAYLDDLISWIAAAQEPSGYLYTVWTSQAHKQGRQIICSYIEEPWDNIRLSHELYNAGHMYEAAVAHYQATGKRDFLDVAIKNADLIVREFHQEGRIDPPGCQGIEIGLVKLYRVTGNRDYLDQAKFFLDMRGRNDDRRRLYGHYSQDHKPVTEQTEAVGHAVRAAYMYSAMADVAALTGDEAYFNAVNRLWENVVNKKLYITGGIGARHAGESFGDNYELPNRTAYCETCAAIANVFWNHRMFLLHGKSGYIDVMELALYNNMLSGVALDGMEFFYPNPLESVAGHNRQPWFGCACCPSNVSRFMASVPGYAYAVSDTALYINLFASSEVNTAVDGKPLRVLQETNYPYDGRVHVTVYPESTEQFRLHLRIPGWAQKSPVPGSLYSFLDSAEYPVQLTVNGQSVTFELNNGYAVLNRTWRPGDQVTLTLPMSVRRVLCNENVETNIGKTALMRGPIVYCLEGLDVEEGRVLNLMLPDEATLTPEFKPELLNGATILNGTAVELRRTDEDDIERNSRRFSAIPYHLWAHRGRTPMAVWLARTEDAASPDMTAVSTIASQSSVSASFLTNVGASYLQSVQNQQVPASSADHENGFFHWMPRRGTTEWIQYDFGRHREISETAVYWFDNRGRGANRTPASWRALYRDGETWRPVEAITDYTTYRDRFNRVRFNPVETDALRLEVTLQQGHSAGMLEWTVK